MFIIRKVVIDMSKKNMKLGVASALAIGAGAAIVAKKSKKSEKRIIIKTLCVLK